jgi:hypothetical protein
MARIGQNLLHISHSVVVSATLYPLVSLRACPVSRYQNVWSTLITGSAMSRITKTCKIALGGILATAAAAALVASDSLAQNLPPPPAPTPPVAPTAPNLRPELSGRPLERRDTVLDRPRPELDPLGVRLGAFFLYPRVILDELYNDNIFATATNRRHDFITVVSPSAQLLSNWSQHQIELRAGASVGTYARTSSENYGDYFVSANGRYDISRSLYGYGGARYDHLHEERDSPDTTVGTTEPVEFDVYQVNAGIAQTGLRIGYDASVGFRREDYSNASGFGGTTVIEDGRDINVYTGAVRVNYEIFPRYQAFVRGEVNHREYDNIGGIFGPSRNSNGGRADAGITLDITGVTFAEAFVGYIIQDYENTAFSNIQGVDFGGRVVWNPSQLTTVTFLADRRVQDTNTVALSSQGVAANSPGYLRSDVGVTVDHELLRNVLLNFRLNYENDDYKGIDRTDNRYDIGAGARYFLNRNIYLGASYTYTKRESAGVSKLQDFDRNLVLIRLGAQI